MSVQKNDTVHVSQRRDQLILGNGNDVVFDTDDDGSENLRTYQRSSISRDGLPYRYDHILPRECNDGDDDSRSQLHGRQYVLPRAKCTLQTAASVVAACLVVGELTPSSLLLAIAGKGLLDYLDWTTMQIVFLALLCIFVVLLGSVGGMRGDWATPRHVCWCGGTNFSTAEILLTLLNLLPVAVWAIASYWADSGEKGAIATVDSIGIVTARLARLDLSITILLSSRGHSTWLNHLSAGWCDLPEMMSLHRSSGFWCITQSMTHSICYFLFYYLEGGIEFIWFSCFPVADPRPEGCGTINRLGLVNFLGIVALAPVTVPFLVVPALPWFRSKGKYHIFQRLHLPAAVVFVVASALHDLPILTIAIPGVADWLMGRYEVWREGRRYRLLTATARLLTGTSGPWVELSIHCRVKHGHHLAPRGEWGLLRVPVLSGEVHPFSVATDATNVIAALISANGGDWTHELAAFATNDVDGRCNLRVDLYGPFASGGGDWSLMDEPSLLLVVGGTGIFGYLPALSVNNVPAIRRDRFLHLVWCVKTMADYYALAARLPSQHGGVRITVFVTNGCSQVNIVRNSIMDNVTTVTSTARRAGCQELVDDINQQENSVDRHRSEVTASLVAALCSLAFVHWGWTGIRIGLLPTHPRSLMSYMMWWRLMPVVLLLAAVIITTLLGSWVANWITRRNQGAESGLIIIQEEEAEYEHVSERRRVDVQDRNDDDYPRDECGRHFQAGRPDLAALVRSAAVASVDHHMMARPQQSEERLMVVACGPPSLVQSTRDSVALVRKENCGLRICFSGTDSRW